MLIGGAAYGQQLPQLTQYLFNAYSINPAVAGTGDDISINSINRYQWEGIVDAPRTYTLSVQAPLKNDRSGIGTYLYTDIAGPTRRIGLQGSYSYILPLKDNLKLSLALSAGMMQFAIDGHKIDLAEDNDVAIQNSLGSRVLFDAKFGMYLYSDKFYFGLSLPQLAQNRLSVYEGITESQSFLSNHFYANIGYKFDVNDDISLEPSSLVKYVSPAPVKIDVNLKFEYQKKLWIAGGWRSSDAVNFMFGYNWNDNLVFGYGHDFTNTDLSEYSGSTHEILLGIKVSRKKKKTASNL
ncbi:MAG: type IX secretion system PorP/SprF family membrane protein [Patiriisocius sp.]|jgi:type IX secretion system PorP/SprF family membrane protein